ncbi:sulfurtransferase [Pimelobacter simplex]|uniref:sulfurtransferase n=1 Tax=Nocardioides simplex TaxID=2045 RepID=UPI00366BDCBB
MTRSGLIGVDELLQVVGEQAEVTLLDVRYRMGGGPSGVTAFAAGHVPGAAYVDLDRALAAPAGDGGRGRHPLPEVADFQAAMREVGVRDDRPVVVYDDWAGHAAARCWWLLRYHGHQDVRVLDGGWSAWQEAGGPIETGRDGQDGRGGRTSGTFTARPGALPAVDVGTVRQAAVVVDARAAERYHGEVEPIDPVAGHVPGAVNVPTSRNLDERGRFREPAELAAVYAEVGAVPGADVAVYCGSGVTAAHDVLALELAGVRAALYPGSWSEWVADPGRPVERS